MIYLSSCKEVPVQTKSNPELIQSRFYFFVKQIALKDYLRKRRNFILLSDGEQNDRFVVKIITSSMELMKVTFSGNNRKLFIKPASFLSTEQNGNSSENGATSSPIINNNPFLKCEKDDVEFTKHEEKGNDIEKDPAKQTNNLFKPANNLFANAASSTLSENSSFVFGQNLRERVVIVGRLKVPTKDALTNLMAF